MPVVEDCTDPDQPRGEGDRERNDRETPESTKVHQQGRQDSNLRHLVLETSALPAELRPSAGRIVALPRMLSQRHALGLLFVVLGLGFAFIAVSAALAGYWVIGVPAAALAVWMASMSARLLRRR